MLKLLPPMNYRPPRRPKARKRRPAPPLPPMVVTSIVNVTPTVSGLEVNLAVDTTEAFPLLPTTAADPTKWTAQYDATLYVGASVETVGWNELLVVFAISGYEERPALVEYSANPSDISDTLGRMLGAFELAM
jgi:hypothetical protein